MEQGYLTWTKVYGGVDLGGFSTPHEVVAVPVRRVEDNIRPKVSPCADNEKLFWT